MGKGMPKYKHFTIPNTTQKRPQIYAVARFNIDCKIRMRIVLSGMWKCVAKPYLPVYLSEIRSEFIVWSAHNYDRNFRTSRTTQLLHNCKPALAGPSLGTNLLCNEKAPYPALSSAMYCTSRVALFSAVKPCLLSTTSCLFSASEWFCSCLTLLTH